MLAGDGDIPGWMIAVAVTAGLLAGYLLATLQYHYGLVSLRIGLMDAQDGNLKPVSVPESWDPLLNGIYHDYNKTITSLSAMFTLVEECQVRVLAERNRMNVVVQVLPAALIGVDDNLCINMANKQASSLFGISEGQLAGVSLFDILKLSDEHLELLRDAFLYRQNIRNQVINLEICGKDLWLSINLSFVSENEADMAAVITLLDITEYRQLQEGVYTREKLVAMGQLAAGVAHELNTPLGNILGYSQLLQGSVVDTEKSEQYVKIIIDETKRCSRIIQNLLNYVRKEQCQGDYCDVTTMIDEVVDTLISCRLKNYNISVERIYDGHPQADGGCGGLDIVLTNLLINSVKALSGRENPFIRILVHADAGQMLSIVVEDNGPGIPNENRTRIFEPFFTTADVGDGSGLGLSISHAMVVRRGGTLRYDGQYTDGARFIIRLPCSKTIEKA